MSVRDSAERMTEFKVKINGGKTRTLKVATSIYCEAVAAVPAIFGTRRGRVTRVEIWCDDLLPEIKPFHYEIRRDRFGRFVVQSPGKQFAIPGEDDGIEFYEFRMRNA